mgnify:FL=1
MSKRTYSFKIDKGSKNIKVFEDREQDFKLVSIKHNKNLYLSLLHIKASLKLSSLGNLKNSLKRFEKFSPNEKAVFEVLIIDNRKTVILPFVKDIIIFQFLNTKKYLSRTPKKQAFLEWLFAEVLSNKVHNNYDFIDIYTNYGLNKNTKKEIQQAPTNIVSQSMKQDMQFENLPKHIYNPDIYNCNEKITMVINKRKISFEIDKENRQIYCTSGDLAIVFHRPHRHTSSDIFELLKQLDDFGQTSKKINFKILNEDAQYNYLKCYKITTEGISILGTYYCSKPFKSSKFAELYKEIYQTMKSLEEWHLSKIQTTEFKETELNSHNSTNIDGECGVVLFENFELGKIRVKGDSENPLFCLADICEILEHSNASRVKEILKIEFGDDLTLSYPIFDNLGREQKATFISEPQLYFVLMRSDKPKAKPFRQWVINEVLPQIRKQGKYEYKGQGTTNTPPPIQEELISELLKQNNMLMQYILKNKSGE